MHIETRYFFIFQNILGIKKAFFEHFLKENTLCKVKKQDIENRSGGEGWRQQEKEVLQNLVG